MSKRIFDMAPSRDCMPDFRTAGMFKYPPVRLHGNDRLKSAEDFVKGESEDSSEIARLKEIIREKDERISKLERQLFDR